MSVTSCPRGRWAECPSVLKTDHSLTGAGLFVFNLLSFMVDARRLCLSGDVEVITEMWRETWRETARSAPFSSDKELGAI